MKRLLQRAITFLLIGILVVEPLPTSISQLTQVKPVAAEVSGGGSTAEEKAKEKAEEEAKKKAEEEAKKKAEEEAKKKAEEEAKQKAEEEARQKAEEEAKKKAEEEAKQKAEEEAKKKAEEEAKQKAEEEAKKKAEEEAKQKAEEKAEKEKAEAEAAAKKAEAARKAEAQKEAETKSSPSKKAAPEKDKKSNAPEKSSKQEKSSRSETGEKKGAAEKQTPQKEDKEKDSPKKADSRANAADEKVVTGDGSDGGENASEGKNIPAEDAATVKDEEKTEEKTVEMPAKTFEGGANGLTVKVKVKKDTFPKGTEMKVKSVSSDSVIGAIEKAAGAKMEKVKAVDISFYYEGKEIQPKKSVDVTLKASGMNRAAKHKAFHVSGGHADVVDGSMSGTTANFDAKHFSTYAIGEFKAQTSTEEKDDSEEGDSDEDAEEAQSVSAPAEAAGADDAAEKSAEAADEADAGSEETITPEGADAADAEQDASVDEADAADETDSVDGDTDAVDQETADIADENADAADQDTADIDGEGADSTDEDAAGVHGEDENTIESETPEEGKSEEEKTEEGAEIKNLPNTKGIKAAPKAADPDALPEDAEGTPEEEPVLRDGETQDGEQAASYWEVTFVDENGEEIEKRNVEAGQAIGSFPSFTEEDGYNYWWEADGSRVEESYVPSGNVTVALKSEKITYTVSFYESESAAEAIATKTVDVDTSFYLNDIPAVPEKSGYAGKWVYSGGDFGNTVAISSDTRVWASYEQNEFTVTWMADGEEYLTETYEAGETISLPPEPVIDGKKFEGWFVGETEYTGGEEVTSDLTITAKLTDQLTVRFIVKAEDGGTAEDRVVLTHYVENEGDTIGSVPQAPFVSGKTFEKWVKEGTDEEVTAQTAVTESFDAVAVFKTIEIYKIKAIFYYESINQSGTDVDFETQITEVNGDQLPYTITAPSYTQTDSQHIDEGPIYYPETPTVEVTKEDFGGGYEYTVRIKYVSHTAVYDYVYLLKDLEGDGYTEIDRTDDVEGVLGSYVTPEIKNFEYAVLERAEGATITQATGQELNVYYTRKDFALSYETNGGSYVPGTTAPYGSTVTLAGGSDVPTREGYTFDGWYLDEALTQAAGSSVTLNEDTTVYAKWRGQNVHYTIAYLFEKYNEAGTESSYVYDNSEDGTAAVGSTVRATDSGIPDKTRKGWEKDTERNSASSVVVQADGSSVLFVYYKLKEYTFNFNAGTFAYNFTNYNAEATLTGKGVTGTGTLNYTMTVKLGQDITSTWPADVTGRYYRNNRWRDIDFDGWYNPVDRMRYVTKRWTVTEEMLPNTGTTNTFTAQWTSNATTHTVNYYLQNADDNNYTRSEEYSQTYTSSGGNLGAKEIAGYTHVRTTTQGNNTTNFYYDRDTYSIEYVYNGTTLRTIDSVKFDANISSSTYNWTPTAAQCGVDSDYTWGGWHSDNGLTTTYTFSTMPASNLVVYGKWSPPSYTVDFEMDGGTPAVPDQTVEKYNKVEKPANPTREGYTFEGWHDAEGNLFDWNTQIVEDTTIYAHWILKPLSYTVHYQYADTGAEISPDKVVTNPNFTLGEVAAETALTIPGYRPDQGEKSVTLALSGNEITFLYSKKTGTTGYTVHYYIEGTTIPVAADKVVEDLDDSTLDVIELAAPVDYDALYAAHPEYDGQEFFPDQSEKTLVLGVDIDSNVLTFYYSRFKSAKVTVNYVDMDGVSIPGHSASTKVLKAGQTFTLTHTPVSGWEFYKAVEGTSLDGTAAGTTYEITGDEDLTFTLFYQKKVTLTVLSASKAYDGTMLPYRGSTVDGLVEGDEIYVFNESYVGDEEGGRINVGVCTITPSKLTTFLHQDPEDPYYKVRYVSGTLEVTKANVTVRIEPDRWTGNEYNGTEYKAGFTNDNKEPADYVKISNQTYKNQHLIDILRTVIRLETVHEDPGAGGLGFYVEAQKDAGDYTYSLGFTTSDLPQDNNYSVALYVRDGRLQINPKEATVTTESGTKTYDGTPLTKEEASITGLVEADEGKVTVTGTGSQTEVGSSENTYRIDWGDVKSSNYTITEELGTLEVTEGELVITVKDAARTYNGSEQKGYDAPETVTGTGETIETDEYIITGLAKDQTLTITGYTASSGTDFGTYTNGSFEDAEITVMDGEEDVTGYYTIETAAGSLTIERKAVTITAKDSSKEYDGSALTESGFENTALEEGDDHTFTVVMTEDSTITNVGTQDNVIATVDGVEVSAEEPTQVGNYTVQIVKGTLTVKPKAVTITAKDAEKVYDGTALTNDGFQAEGLADEDTHEFTVVMTADSTITDVGTQDNVIATVDGVEVSAEEPTQVGNYTVQIVKGTLTVKPKAVTITAKDAEKVYDGTALTNDGFQVEGLADEDTHEFTVVMTSDSTITDVGTQDNVIATVDGVEVSAEEPTQVGNYTVQIVKGTLTVKPKEVTITAKDSSKEYDGSALTESGFENTALEAGDDHTFTVEMTDDSTITDVGTQDNVIATVDGVEVSAEEPTQVGNYTVQIVKGTLTVKPKAVTITAESSSQTYNGSALTEGGFTATGLAETDSHTFTVEMTADSTITDVGTQDNVIATVDGVEVSAEEPTQVGNYTVQIVKGTLTVNPKAVTITAKDADKAYDGTALTQSGFTATALEEGDTHEFTVVMTEGSTITDVGTESNVIATVDGVAVTTGTAVTIGNYIVTTADGTLTITKDEAELVITSADNSWTYDSKLHKEETYTVKQGETEIEPGEDGKTFTLSNGDVVTITPTAEGVTNVSDNAEKNNTYTFTITRGGQDTSGNYQNVVQNTGTLTINPKEVTITADDAEKPYDGSPLTQDRFKAGELEEGDTHTFTVEMTDDSTITNVGTQPNVIATVDGVEVTSGTATAVGNYMVTTADGTLTITGMKVTITAEDAEKTYNGSPLTQDEFKVTGLAENDDHTFTVEMTEDSTITDAGTQPNVIATVDGAAVETGVETAIGNYLVTTVNGTLTVNEKAVTITAENAGKDYDGTALTQSGFTATELESGDTHTFTVVMTDDSTITNVGTQPNVIGTVDGVAVTTGTETKVGNYLVTTVDGELKIDRRAVTITADNDSRTYNGSALTNDGFQAEGLADSDTHEFTVVMTDDSTITNIGTQPNVVATVDGVAVTTGTETEVGNYLVTTVDGTLTVTPKEVTITAKDADKAYDGTALTQNGFTATALEEGDSHEFTVVMTEDSTITDVGTQPNVIATVDGVEVTTGEATAVGNYLVTTASGTLTITQDEADLVISSIGKSWTYDAQLHKNEEYTVKQGETSVEAGEDGRTFTLGNGDVVTITPTAEGVTDVSDTAAENNTYTYTITRDGKDTSGNYKNVVTNIGTLTINPKAVAITAKDAQKTYDGSALTESGFTAGALESGDDHTFTVVMTDDSTITDAGSQPNVIATVDGVEVTTGEATAVGNYLVTTADGTLTVNAKAVTITAKDAQKTYDGTALTESGFTATDLEAGDTHKFTVEMTDDSTITDAGTQPNVIATVDGVEVTTGTATQVGSYLVTTVNGTLTVNEKAVTITAENAGKDYDGTALTESGFTATELESGDTHTFTVVMTDDSTITNVGTQPNVIGTVDGVEVTTGTETKVGNYLVTTVDGELKINRRAVTITADNDSRTYNGSALTNDGFQAEGLADGDTHEFTVVMTDDSTITNIGTQPNVVATVDGVAVTTGTETEVGNYLVTTVDGTLTVTPKEVTITAKDANKAYDGKALTESGFTAGALEDGDSHEFTVEMTEDSTITDVGTQPNVIATVDGVEVTTGEAAAVGNYLVTTASGTLTITQDEADLVISSIGKNWTYDAQLHKNEEYTVTQGETSVEAGEDGRAFTLGNGDVVTITPTAAGVTDVSDTAAENNTYTYTITRGGKDTSGNYKTVVTNIGTLTINPKPVAITAKDAQKTYDGSPLTESGFTAGALESGDDHTFTVVMTDDSTITDAGSQPNVIATVDGVEVTTGEATAVGNYLVTTADGTLTVSAKAVTITAKDAQKTYDRTALTESGFTATDLEAGDTHVFTVEMTDNSTITDAGTQPNVIATVDGVAVTEGRETEVGNYKVTTESGTLSITKAALTVTTGGGSKEYDGTALTNGEVTVTGFAEGETAKFKTTGSQTEVGSSKNTYDVDWGNVKADNYEISHDLGDLVVTANTTQIILTAASADKIYDGTALTDKTVTVTGTLPEGHKVQATTDGSQTDAGSSENQVANGYKILDAEEKDVTAFFSNVSKGAPGTLTVNPAPVTVTTGSRAKAYDGTPLINSTVKIEGLVEGESVTLTATGSQTDVGSSDNTYSIVWDNAKEQNYTVTENLGTLTVTERDVDVILRAESGSKVYDGSPLTGAKVYVTGLQDLTGFTVKATVTGSQTDAGSSQNVVNPDYAILDADGRDVTHNFKKIELVPGTLTVNPAPVTITTGTSTKAYDGKPLTNSKVTATGFVESEGITVTANGTITDVGSVENTYTINWNGANASNYTITDTLGTLTVAPVTGVTLTAGSATKPYDGKALINSTVTATGLPEGFTVTATTSGSAVNVKDSGENTVNDGYVIKNAKGEDVTAFFPDIKLVTGTLEITPRPITITSASAEKVYDGTPLTEDTITIDGLKTSVMRSFMSIFANSTTTQNLVGDDSITVNVTGEQTEVGSSKNTFEIIWDNADEANYDVTPVYGTLTVTEAEAEEVVPDDDEPEEKKPAPKKKSTSRKKSTSKKKSKASSDKSGDVTSPRTGDTTNMFLWIALLLLAAAIAGALWYTKKRMEKDRQKQ